MASPFTFYRGAARIMAADLKDTPPLVEAMSPVFLGFYGGVCGWTLARAHARSGGAVELAAYLGKSDKFDRSILDFSERYADQNELDYLAFKKAVRSGRLEAVEGI